MANPQVEDGFTRIANALFDEILRRDFSKRQQNIVLLIWRLSYGCRKKECVIPKQKFFQLAGLYKTDIAKELKYLMSCKVLINDGEIYAINKDFERWQISPSKTWDDDLMTEAISLNLRKRVSETLTTKSNSVSETLTNELGEVSKTLTTKLVKHLPRHASIASGTRDSGRVKTLLKTFKDKNKIELTSKSPDNPFTFYQQNFGIMNPQVSKDMLQWLEDYSDDVIIYAMKITLDKPPIKQSWGTVKGILGVWFRKGVKTLQEAEAAEVSHKAMYQTAATNNGRSGKGYSGKQSLPIAPDGPKEDPQYTPEQMEKFRTMAEKFKKDEGGPK